MEVRERGKEGDEEAFGVRGMDRVLRGRMGKRITLWIGRWRERRQPFVDGRSGILFAMSIIGVSLHACHLFIYLFLRRQSFFTLKFDSSHTWLVCCFHLLSSVSALSSAVIRLV